MLLPTSETEQLARPGGRRVGKNSLKSYLQNKQQRKLSQLSRTSEVETHDLSDLERKLPNVVESVMDKVSPAEVYLQTIARKQPLERSAQSEFFPSNLYFEGHDQHSRWFLTSLVSSVALAGQSPFANLKTHGMLLNESGRKMSKSDPTGASAWLDPDDLINGTVKLDG